MSKPLWLYEQVQRNPFGSTHYYWIDAGLAHTVPAELLQADSFIRLAQQHQRFLLLCYPHDPSREVHGFDAAALAQHAGVERTRWVAQRRHCCCLSFGSDHANHLKTKRLSS
jgi:hypothetical protein